MSASSDVAVLPAMNHHLHNNHLETPTKSRKRSRSPSLTADDSNDIHPQTSSIETPTKRTRKKRANLDIDQSLGRHLSADKIYIYRWPDDESQADFHVLQEQICDFLSLKSFKRKYPDIYRRNVDLREREYLRSQSAVTETQCDLGLTALKLDEVLHLISADYPEKYSQFNDVWQQKRRSLTISNNHTNQSMINSSNHSSLSTQQSLHSSDHGEKNRASKLRQDLLRSAMDFNSQLQKERRQERKACFDLQTMQIHFPSSSQLRLDSNRTQIGSYPLALLPGQYQDAFIKYRSDELKYMPINTALFYYPKPMALINSDRFAHQAHGSDEEDETLPTTGPLARILSEQNPTKSPNILMINGTHHLSSCPTKPSTSISTNSSSHVCHMCHTNDGELDQDLVTCTSCKHHFHPTCLDVNNDMLTIIKTYSWQCIDCKSCMKCNKTHDEANMMFCDRCDRGYHTYCVGLEAIPDGSWQCSACDPPASPVAKGRRGRPPLTSRSSPQQRQPSATPPKIENPPTRVSSRRAARIIPTPPSPSNNLNHSSNSSSNELLTTNSSSTNLNNSRHRAI